MTSKAAPQALRSEGCRPPERPRRRLIAALAALPAAAFLPPGWGQPEGGDPLLDVLQGWGATGAVIGIWRAGEAPVVRALGSADGAGTPVSVSRALPVGSVGKAFLGVAFLRAAASAGLALEAPVSRVLPGFPGAERVSFWQLGTHRASLAEPLGDAEFQRQILAQPDRRWTHEELLEAVRRRGALQPRRSPRYSNAHSLVLGEALARLAGQPLPEVLAECALEPLGLRHTRQPAEEDWRGAGVKGFRHAPPERPIGYGQLRIEATRFSPSLFGVAGDWSATVGDLLAAARTLGEGEGAFAEVARIHRESLRAASRWADPALGFHWMRFGRWVGHTGDVPGFSAVMAYDRRAGEARAALVNLSNTAGGKAPARLLVDRDWA